ncbi:major facilitator superfamily transporter [Hyaloscypha bicolor E]|uniref:Lysosomal dipeptide transporter MFSD1 n=1 Tax=Hyaloscypha bicolor E TaxID=1095630 RepID=A0A2J6SNG5_9HELO|nr:major facilitator superfamily transporter [Hyaloscypha bicolor E]PMD52312.1 major facilitator superfamily transporter [Hyaloscypha bicolor E]
MSAESQGHKGNSGVEVSSIPADGSTNENSTLVTVPLSFKLASILLVSAIGFGSSWSGGITGAMKTTLKKGLNINNTQFALLEASEDFMVTALVLLSGVVTDRIGGASAILYGNVIYTVGSILVAAATTVRSYKFMIFGRVVLALGDIATQIAQYKIFSSWFPPSHGFAATLGLELGIGKIGGFVGKSTANIIAKKTGDFSWVFWTAVFMNLFTNFMTVIFYFFTRYCKRTFKSTPDPATGEELTEKNKKFELGKVLELPWVFWGVMGFSLFETSTAIVFQQNATELAQLRFGTDAVTAGWYTSVLQYAGFFVVPCVGIFIDLLGNRITLMVLCGAGVFLSMCLVNWATTTRGTAAAFGIYAVAYSFGPTTIIDSIRTSLWHSSVFGSAYACKITMNNALKVTPVYVVLSVLSFIVSLAMLTLFLLSKTSTGKISSIYVDIGRLQWTRKQRLIKGDLMNERKLIVGGGEEGYGEKGREMKRLSKICFGALMCLVLGSWVAYFWGVATGNNE